MHTYKPGTSMYIIMIITILVKIYFVPNENIPVYRK